MSSSTAQQGRDVGESVLATATDKTKSLYSKVTNNWLVASYVRPAGTKVKGLYDRCPALVKVTLLALAALSAIPLACFFGFMAVVTAGCLIVGGIAFTIVEVGLYLVNKQASSLDMSLLSGVLLRCAFSCLEHYNEGCTPQIMRRDLIKCRTS